MKATLQKRWTLASATWRVTLRAGLQRRGAVRSVKATLQKRWTLASATQTRCARFGRSDKETEMPHVSCKAAVPPHKALTLKRGAKQDSSNRPAHTYGEDMADGMAAPPSPAQRLVQEVPCLQVPAVAGSARVHTHQRVGVLSSLTLWQCKPQDLGRSRFVRR